MIFLFLFGSVLLGLFLRNILLGVGIHFLGLLFGVLGIDLRFRLGLFRVAVGVLGFGVDFGFFHFGFLLVVVGVVGVDGCVVLVVFHFVFLFLVRGCMDCLFGCMFLQQIFHLLTDVDTE